MAGENAYQGYWRVYGGIAQLLRSTYFWLALVLTILSRELWLPVAGQNPAWVALTVDVVPSILGFALGGMAIMLAFSSGKFLDAIRQKGKANSYFLKMMASFFHFAIVLTSSLVLAFLQNLTWLGVEILTPLSSLGFFMSIYGILLVLATVAGIWHTARIFNEVRDNDPPA